CLSVNHLPLLQAYAKFAGAPLKLHKIGNPWRSPTGSLPALKTRKNGSLSQPSDIIIHLRKQKYNADFDLSAKEEADTLAFISLLEEKLMPALVYTRWIDPKNYVEVTRRWHAKHAPFPLNFFLPGSIQRQQLERLRLVRGDEELTAGEELELYCDFFFGDSPSPLDSFVFGYLGRGVGPHNILYMQYIVFNDIYYITCYCCLTFEFHVSHFFLFIFCAEGFSRKVSSQPEGGDADNEPGKRRKQLLSVLVALGAMLSYALLTGIVAIQHVKQEALDHRSPGLTSLSSNEEEDEEGRG
uniref:Mitochondrial outer membrane transport complex Sam37/metaxin N-terminal domain-containing protein n=1 Tax=Oncorhynchus tshawytscha TaxID=74940 RepID=A0A8C8FFQ0_ONCTS